MPAVCRVENAWFLLFLHVQKQAHIKIDGKSK